MNKILPTWIEIQSACEVIAYRVKKNDPPDYIIGLTRGGLIPATILSHMLDIPLIPISYSSEKGKGEFKQYSNKLPIISKPLTSGIGHSTPPTLLIVDDICDTGNTMREVCDGYKARNHVVYSAAIHHKDQAAITPDYTWKKIPVDAPWVIYPWEV